MDALTVSELCLRVKSVLRAEPGLQDIWVEGEVSNARPAASGHWYWTIKDAAGSFKWISTGDATRPARDDLRAAQARLRARFRGAWPELFG